MGEVEMTQTNNVIGQGEEVATPNIRRAKSETDIRPKSGAAENQTEKS
jgi:hypothetical protein